MSNTTSSYETKIGRFSALFIEQALWILMAFITISLSFLEESSAAQLSPGQIYNRCYTQLVGSTPPANDPWLLQVNAGSITPVQACMNVLNLGNLNASNMLASTDPRAPLVLRTMHNFHKAWFPQNNFTSVAAVYQADQDIYDPNSPSYFITHALFAPNGQFKEIVTGNNVWQAVRKPAFTGQGQVNNVAVDGNLYTNISFSYLDAISKSIQLWTPGPTFVPRGQLIGFTTPPADPFTAEYQNPNHKTQPTPIDGMNAVTDLNYPANGGKSGLGGGVLGSPSYFMLTSGRLITDIDDGGRLMPRAWSLALFQDLLNRPAPLLRNQDVTSMVQPQSTLPFRLSSNCMQCHGSLDGAAATARNLVYFPDNVPINKVKFNSVHLYQFPVSQSAPPSTPPSTVDFDGHFSQESPTGVLFFRSYTGTLINQPVTGLAGLGAALAQTPDLYFSAASRYLQFFTGISIYIGDYGDPMAATPTATELTNRNFVMQLGQQLQSTQSLPQLIQAIFSSPYYGLSDYGMGNQ